MTSGRTFDVRHPEMIRVGENSVVVFQYDKQDERLFESFKMLGLSRMESLERLEMQSSANCI